MLTIDELSVGQGLHIQYTADIDAYALVIGKSGGAIRTVTVRPVMPWTKCYDDCGAVRSEHEHNVRLKDCPPPFSKACGSSRTGTCYAYADMANAVVLDNEKLSGLCIEIIDGGGLVSDRDMKEVFDHPWPDQFEKELPAPSMPRRIPGLRKTQNRYAEAASVLGLMDVPEPGQDVDGLDGPGGDSHAGIMSSVRGLVGGLSGGDDMESGSREVGD